MADEWSSIAAVLDEAGLDADSLGAALAAGSEELARAVARHLTFPGRRHLLPRDVWGAAGVDEETARELWRAMGFPEVPDDEPAFTEGDVDALRTANALFERAGMSRPVMLQQARAMSQAASRIAASHQDVIGQIAADPDPARDASDAIALARDTLPALDALLVYLYRRHLAAATEQQLRTAEPGGATTTLSVGFADLSGWTEQTRAVPVDELAALVEGFNATTSRIVTGRGGRVVKTIGDEVMFASPDAAAAATIALDLSDEVERLRVGVATGDVLAREGDVFGAPVNLASRLVALAREGTVLVDDATQHAVGDQEGFRFRRLAPRPVKGLGRLRPWRVDREEGAQ